MSLENVNALVIDCGSHMCRAGYSDSDSPRAVFPPMVGRPKHSSLLMAISNKDAYVGDEASTRRRGILRYKCPIERGLITGWDDMEKIWYHTFYNELREAPEEHPVFLTETPLNSKAVREKMTQIMFENFEVPALYIAAQAVCALASAGKNSGIVLDSGGGISYSVSIYEGISIPHTTCKLDFAGNDLTDWLLSTLMERGFPLYMTSSCKDIARDIKEKLCYVSLNYREEVNQPPIEKHYELPDGNVVTVGKDRFQIVEPLFNPSLLNMESYGLQEMILRSISKCDLDLKREMYNNIVICGGNTMFKGFSERLTNELNEIVPSMIRVNIPDIPVRNYSTFIGAAILANHLMSISKFTSDGIVDSLSSSWILKEDYNEYGNSVIHRKCF